MHVWSRTGDIAESRRFESAPFGWILGHRITAFVRLGLIRPNAQIVVGVAREVNPFVTGIAFGFAEINVFATILSFGQRLFIAGLKLIVSRVPTKHCALEGCDRLGHMIHGNFIGPKHFLKHAAIAFQPPQRTHHGLMGITHFNRILNGSLSLLFQRRSTAIPKLSHTVGAINHGWRGTAATLPLDTFRVRIAVGISEFRMMATGARNSTVRRKARIKIQQPA